jgi:hypothetical protein
MLPKNSKVRIRKLKYDECKECPHCGDPQYNDGLKIGGHIQFCPNRYMKPISTKVFTEESICVDDIIRYDISTDNEEVYLVNEIDFTEKDDDYSIGNDYIPDNVDFTSDFFQEAFIDASYRYLARQRELLDTACYRSLEAGNVLMLHNIRRPASFRNYFEVAEYVSCNHLSLGAADELLSLIRKVTLIGTYTFISFFF